MRIDELLGDAEPTFSFEFFPPKTPEGEENLYRALHELRPLDPAYVSVTYGAGGSTRGKTVEIVTRIKEEFGLEAMAHFTCVGATTDELRDTLDELRAADIENVLALRGDPPAGQEEWTKTEGGLEYSHELVELLRDDYPFAVGAACFPEGHIHATSPEDDLRYLKEKVDAGVDFLITQLFFDNELYYDFVARARAIGVTVPIVPGIWPITSYAQIDRVTAMCGATMPEHVLAELRGAQGRRRGRGRVRRLLRDDAVRRPAGQGRARPALLHPEPLARDARDPQRPEALAPVGLRPHGPGRAAPPARGRLRRRALSRRAPSSARA